MECNFPAVLVDLIEELHEVLLASLDRRAIQYQVCGLGTHVWCNFQTFKCKGMGMSADSKT
jgi:hypothetical protein